MRKPIPCLFSMLIAFSLVGCANVDFIPVPDEGAKKIPNTSQLSLQKGNLIINAEPISFGRLNRYYTVVNLILINPTDSELTFYPKQFLLFDQNNQQFHPLSRDAIAEAAYSSVRYYPSYHYGFGYHHGHYYGHHSFYHGYYHYPYYHGYYYDFERLLSYALPLRPITIYPDSSVSGYLYFPTPAKELQSLTLAVTRFTREPSGPDDVPPEVTYRYQFGVLD